MPIFSDKSRNQLDTCHPELQLLFDTVIKTFNCVVIEGHRDEHDQNKAYEMGNSKLKYPKGRHNAMPSMAADVAPYPLDWKDIARFNFFAGYVLGVAERLYATGAMKYKVRWGGDWNSDTILSNENFKDLVHFELRGSP